MCLCVSKENEAIDVEYLLEMKKRKTLCEGKIQFVGVKMKYRYKMKENKSKLVIFYLIQNRVSPNYTHNS